jgi:RHS repeat-associated protein
MGDWLFSYDAMDRLTAAAAGSSAPAAFADQTVAWSYDSYGNRTAQTFSGNAINSNWATYNSANNRINTAKSAVAGYIYDASGNTLNDGNNKYWYDAEGQQCAVQSLAVTGLPITQYIYDAEGARIAKTTIPAAPATATSLCAPPLGAGYTLSARYLVDQGGDQVTEINGAGVWQHSNVFSAARLTATYDKLGLHYELADPLGTKRVQANTKGFVEEWYASLPYGDALTPIPNTACTSANNCFAEDATEHHFTGKERDTESGNDYFEARYYSSAMGRFMSPDWAPNVQAIPYADFTHPQTLNLYHYMRNNPLGGVDADGHGSVFDLVMSVVSTKVSTYIAQHPSVAEALSKIAGSFSAKVNAGAGLEESIGKSGFKGSLAASATGFWQFSSKGVTAGMDVKFGASIETPMTGKEHVGSTTETISKKDGVDLPEPGETKTSNETGIGNFTNDNESLSFGDETGAGPDLGGEIDVNRGEFMGGMNDLGNAVGNLVLDTVLPQPAPPPPPPPPPPPTE